MKPFEAGKTYKTRDGRSVRILCTDAKGLQPLVGLLLQDSGEETENRWSANGEYRVQGNAKASPLDLIPEPNTVTVWLTLYEKGVGDVYRSRTDADCGALLRGHAAYGKFLRIQEYTYEVES